MTISFIVNRNKHSKQATIYSGEWSESTWGDLKKDIFYQLQKAFPKNKSYNKWFKGIKKWHDTGKRLRDFPKFKSTISEDDVSVIVWERQLLFKFKDATYNRIFKK